MKNSSHICLMRGLEKKLMRVAELFSLKTFKRSDLSLLNSSGMTLVTVHGNTIVITFRTFSRSIIDSDRRRFSLINLPTSLVKHWLLQCWYFFCPYFSPDPSNFERKKALNLLNTGLYRAQSFILTDSVPFVIEEAVL